MRYENRQVSGQQLFSVAVSLLAGLVFASSVSAQKLVDISSCASMTKDAERFACYDELARKAGAMTPAQSAPSVSSTPAAPLATTAVPATPASPASPVSAPAAKAPVASDAPAVSTTSEPSRIAAFGAAISKALLQTDMDGKEMLLDVVTAAKFYKQDIWQITLSSGQIWRQMNASVFTLNVGDKIQIAPSGWGKSYRLTVQGRNGFIQVERLDNKVRK